MRYGLTILTASFFGVFIGLLFGSLTNNWIIGISIWLVLTGAIFIYETVLNKFEK